MFLIYLLLTTLVAMAILTQTEPSIAQQTEVIPVRVSHSSKEKI